MSQNPPLSASPNLITCSNCHSAMPSELRFCRNCGFRLSSGLGGVDETFNRGDMASAGVSAPAAIPKKRRRMSGMAWIFIGLLVFFIGAAAFTAIISPIKQNVGSVVRTAINRSYVGVNGWDTTDNGVTFQSVDAPGGPADKAGLVGGDIITKFDGQEIRDEDQMEDLMERTPVGKTVDIEYLRDGEKKTTKLTTISQEEFRKLVREFERR